MWRWALIDSVLVCVCAVQNGLFVAAGILQEPFVGQSGSHLDARNFGSIGSILGHEMSHGFDDSGRQYDAQGELDEWWSKETVENYHNRSRCYTSVYDSYRVGGRCCKESGTGVGRVHTPAHPPCVCVCVCVSVCTCVFQAMPACVHT